MAGINKYNVLAPLLKAVISYLPTLFHGLFNVDRMYMYNVPKF